MRLLFAALSLLAVMLFAMPSTGFAFDAYNGIDCSRAPDAAVCNSSDTPIAGPDGLLIKITRIVAFIAGIAAVIIIIISGLRYITASGDPKNVESAKNTLIGAIIGLAVIIAAQAIIVFVANSL